MNLIKNPNNYKKLLVFLIQFLTITQCFVTLSLGKEKTSELIIETNYELQQATRSKLYVGGSGPGNYSKIQYAVDNASDGDTILVYNGTYKENIVIKKIIDLIGKNRDFTIINGGGSGNVIKITANNVSITSFTIRNGGIGVYILRSSNHNIYGNRITDNWEGVGLLQSYGTHISTNIISNNYFEGINPIQSSSVIISGNKIDGNLQGLFISKSGNNTIVSNNIKSNTRGIEIRSSSNNNLIYHNNFINNAEDNAFDECSNSWDNGYPSGGNYWDDYTGIDADGDGIGDTPYFIDGDSNKDNYPFINQSGWNLPPHQPRNPNPENGSTNVDIDADLYWIGGDPDPGDTVTYDVYFGTNNPPPLEISNQSEISYNPGKMIYNTTYYWKIVAWDNLGSSNKSPIWNFTTSSTANYPPNIPSQPNGTEFGFILASYNYSTFSIDHENENISYGWDWDGDLSVDDWSDWYMSGDACTMTHSWNAPGNYLVSVKAKDIHYAESNWSIPLTVKITMNNHPPDAPKINGPPSGKKGMEYEYTFNATDPDSNNIKYYIDWGDDNTIWTDYHESGKEVTLKHVWSKKGTYTIRVKAKDTLDEESEWTTLKVTMPKNQNLWFHWLLIRLPILKYILDMI